MRTLVYVALNAQTQTGWPRDMLEHVAALHSHWSRWYCWSVNFASKEEDRELTEAVPVTARKCQWLLRGVYLSQVCGFRLLNSIHAYLLR